MSALPLPADRLRGLRFLVPAASRGLGFAIAARLAAEGAEVVAAARTADTVARAAATLGGEAPRRIRPLAMDVSDPASVAGGVAAAAAALGGLDGLVTNCGGPRGGGFETLDDDAWRGALDLVLLSAVRLVRAALPHLRAAGGGRIVSVVSSSVRQPVEHLTLSNVLRPALAALVNDLAGAFAGEGILVNALAPGRIDTQRVRELDRSAAERQGISPEEAMRQSAARIPAGRYGEPDEFARAAAFLLSRENTYITGQVLLVDGGLVRAL